VLTGELDTIAAALSSLAARPDWSRSDAAVLADCERVFVLEQRMAAVRLALLGELDARGLAREAGATSTVAWLRWRLRLDGGPAASMVRLARALRSTKVTAAALRAGRVSERQAHAITKSMVALPSEALESSATMSKGDELVARVEILLIEHAASLAPRELRAAGRHALATVAPDVAEEAERRALETAERRATERRRLDLYDDAYGGVVLRGCLDREGAVMLRTALGPLSDPLSAGDERTGAQRRADALVEVCQRVMTEGSLPAQSGEPTQIVVTVGFDALTRSLGIGCTDAGERLSPALVRRLACDARITPAVLDGTGQVLDLGRSRRLFTGAIRRALRIRDRGCAFPGCDREARWTDAHHILHWLLGGCSDLSNGVLVCRIHHGLLHEEGGWTVRLAKDGLPEFLPPPWIDPERGPLRNARYAARPP
jgi:hypothetical protein